LPETTLDPLERFPERSFQEGEMVGLTVVVSYPILGIPPHRVAKALDRALDHRVHAASVLRIEHLPSVGPARHVHG
jgi:hypothetical protein